MKHLLPLSLALALSAFSATAQENLLAGKDIAPLGEAKTWTSQTDQTYSFDTDALAKLVAVPTNTDNVFLFPEGQNGGGYDNEANRAIGIQGFYIDMESSHEVGLVSTTWEGAAANAFDIYLCDELPGLEILDTTPTYSATGLGQYSSNTAVMPAGAKGRYLVFQPTVATNWGWGVKIRSIAATAPVEEEFASFTVSPGMICLGEEKTVSFTFKNQHGVDIAADKVSVSVSDNATLEGNTLVANSGSEVVFTATYNETSLTATVYVLNQAPEAPAATAIGTPIFTNTVTEHNATAVYETAWNGGSVNLGTITFDNGEVAQAFGNTRCVFFQNTATLAGVLDHFNPTERGLRSLHLDIFGTKDATGKIVLEAAVGTAMDHPFTLEAGKWTAIDIDLLGVTNINNMSVRFDEANMCDILLANIYFTPLYVEGDEEAPVLSDISVLDVSMTGARLSFSATDDKSSSIYYTITDGVKTYTITGTSGESVEFTFDSLSPSTDYSFTVAASDGKNVSDSKTVAVRTLGFPDAPQPSQAADMVVAVFSAHYGATALPVFTNWGSAASASEITTESGATLLLLSDYAGQWGGLDNLDTNVENMKYLHIDIYSESDGSLAIAPVWSGVQNTPNKVVNVKASQWNSFDIELTDFGYPAHGNIVAQLSMSECTLPSFAIDNFYYWTEDTGTESIVESIEASESLVDVYSLQGVLLQRGIKRQDAAAQLPAGLYIIGGSKVLVK